MADPRPAGQYAVVKSFETDGTTGHLSWTVQVEEVDAQGNVMTGPPSIFGIDIAGLKTTYAGDPIQYLTQVVKPQMLQQYSDLKTAASIAASIVGTTL
jgi:hypothetical protein